MCDVILSRTHNTNITWWQNWMKISTQTIKHRKQFFLWKLTISERSKVNKHSTVCIRDLDKLNLVRWFGFRLEQILLLSQPPLNFNGFKTDQNHVTTLSSLSLNPWFVWEFFIPVIWVTELIFGQNLIFSSYVGC